MICLTILESNTTQSLKGELTLIGNRYNVVVDQFTITDKVVDVLGVQSSHVETVCLLSKLRKAKHHVSVKLDMDEMDITSAESKATYEEIKKYVSEHNDGMKVSNL